LAFLADNMQTFVDGDPTFTSLPFDGLTPNLSAEEAEFFTNYPETGEVLQSAVSYIDPQWNDIGKDVQSLYLDQMTAEELLQNIDKRRAEQAAQAGDSNWN
jgi:raffinose/stachyose/melibiose transport system substrate-binding protein